MQSAGTGGSSGQRGTQPLPRAGWYPDPSKKTARRWWDGHRWTESTQTDAGNKPKQSGRREAHGVGGAVSQEDGSSGSRPSQDNRAPMSNAAGGFATSDTGSVPAKLQGGRPWRRVASRLTS